MFAWIPHDEITRLVVIVCCSGVSRFTKLCLKRVRDRPDDREVVV